MRYHKVIITQSHQNICFSYSTITDNKNFSHIIKILTFSRFHFEYKNKLFLYKKLYNFELFIQYFNLYYKNFKNYKIY
jgi:hypothetical protein